jgi:hypothetical protein
MSDQPIPQSRQKPPAPVPFTFTPSYAPLQHRHRRLHFEAAVLVRESLPTEVHSRSGSPCFPCKRPLGGPGGSILPLTATSFRQEQ